MPKKFQRSARPRNTKDDKGTVQVRVMLVTGGTEYVKGNISRTMTVKNRTVSEVYAVVEDALFEN